MAEKEEDIAKFPKWFNIEKFQEGVNTLYSYFNLRVQRDEVFVQVTPEMELRSSDVFLLALEQSERSGSLADKITPIRELIKAIHVVFLESIDPQFDTQNIQLADRINQIREPLCALFHGDLMENVIAEIENVSRKFPEWFDIVTFHSRLVEIFRDFHLQVDRKGTFVPAKLFMDLRSTHKYRFRVESGQFKEVSLNDTEFGPFVARVHKALLESITTSGELPLEDGIVSVHLQELSFPIGHLYRSDFISNILIIIHSQITQAVLDRRLAQSS